LKLSTGSVVSSLFLVSLPQFVVEGLDIESSFRIILCSPQLKPFVETGNILPSCINGRREYDNLSVFLLFTQE
jgi:hypothetical protein